MKKLIFMIINMNVGGTEKALINMLNELSKNDYYITILMLEKEGDFLEYLPKNVEIKILDEYKNIKKYFNEPPRKLAFNLLKQGKFFFALSLLFIYILCKFKDNMQFYFKFVLRNLEILDDEYDVAIAYAGPMDLITYFVVNKIKANKKIQWIHFDITKIGFNKKFSTILYKNFNKIFTVSEEGKEKLINQIPELEKKTEKLLNIISSDLVKDMSKKGRGFEDFFEGIRVLTVGRLSCEKGQDLTISVLAKLKKEGYNIKWYCIGEGDARKEYEKKISFNNLEEEYILLGSKINPYPYMKQCDIYVQSSRHEGYCITLAEARCFNNPIVTTNFTGANEQIINEKTGLIVNCNENEIYKAVKRLLDDKNLVNKIKKNLTNEFVDTRNEIEKLNEIIIN